MINSNIIYVKVSHFYVRIENKRVVMYATGGQEKMDRTATKRP